MFFGASGLVSIDYAMKNYGNTTFKPENDSYFSGQNANMSNTLDIRGISGEYKINKLSQDIVTNKAL
jgi:hypothetical protein